MTSYFLSILQGKDKVLEEMMEERGLSIVHKIIMRWVHQYSPELDKKIRSHLKKNRVDEIYIKVDSFRNIFFMSLKNVCTRTEIGGII